MWHCVLEPEDIQTFRDLAIAQYKIDIQKEEH